MKTLVVILACAAAVPALAQDNPFAGMKGKVKEGMWEYKMQMGAIPGMPAGMTMPEMKFNQCITAKDVESGGFSQKDGKLPEGCTLSNVKFSGNNASYRMDCVKQPKMTADVTMTFSGDSFAMKQDMVMDQGGQKMSMTNNMTGKYIGACTK